MTSHPIEALRNDLFSVYQRAGAEVTYETESGQVRHYWARRYLQALKRADATNDLVGFVVRLVLSQEPSRGFYILRAAERLDLTMEALVINAEKPYHDLFDAETVASARHRLRSDGYDPTTGETSSIDSVVPSGAVPMGATTGDLELSALVPGASFDVRVTVGEDGSLSMALI